MRNITEGIVDWSALNKPPEPHEKAAAKYFAKLDYDVIFIKPSNIIGMKSPDFCMNGKYWEVKSPIVFSDSSFEDNFKKAVKQSENLIYDLRRLKARDEGRYKKELEKRKKSRKIKTLIIINRGGELLTFKGKFDIIKT